MFLFLTQYQPWFHETVELGRSCVRKEYRSGRVISLLWEGIGRYILKNDVKYLIGCASLPMEIRPKINEIYNYLSKNHFFNDIAIQPLSDYKMHDLQKADTIRRPKELFRSLPPLIKGYLRLGAYICGEPAYDRLFRTIDFFMVLDRSNIVKRYQDNYLKAI